jgi:thiol-disulfide isomerase/thioredoxin
MNPSLRMVLVAVMFAAAATLGFGLYRWHHAATPADVPAAAVDLLAPAPGKIPDSLPLFALRDRDGQLRSITDWQGKSLVINFWATWCPPCRHEIPLLKTLNAARASQNFQVIGVAVDFRDAVLAYAKKERIDYPLLIGEQDGLDVVEKFGLVNIGLPFTVFTDNQGRVVTLHLGELRPDDANRIFDTVIEVNKSALTLEQAKQKISRELHAGVS